MQASVEKTITQEKGTEIRTSPRRGQDARRVTSSPPRRGFDINKEEETQGKIAKNRRRNKKSFPSVSDTLTKKETG